MAANKEESQDKKVAKVEPLRVALSLPSATTTMRVYYSMYHHWSARHFAALAKQIEDAGGKARFDIKHRSYVTASIFAAVSFLESAINELFKDAWDESKERLKESEYVNSLPPNVLQALAAEWGSTEAVNKHSYSLGKFNVALAAAGQTEFDEGQQPYQDANLLIKLRNTLVHFKPETLGGTDEHQLDRKLRGKFALNKLMDGTGNPPFPDKWLGFGCCEWAVSSTESFADEFFSRMGLAPKYRAVDWPDP